MPQTHSSQFRRRLTISSVSLTLAVAVLGVSGYFGALRSRANLERVGHSHSQLSAARKIALQAQHWTLQLRWAGTGPARPGLADDITTTRAALDASLAQLADATRNYLEYVEDEEEEADESARIDELVRVLDELGDISERTLAGQAWTPATGERVALLSRELDELTAAIEADELGEVEQTMARARASARLTIAIAAVLLGLGLAVTLTVMVVLSRRLRDAIATLLDAASAVARGDLDVRARIAGKDEFAELGRNFDNMVADLDASLKAREAAAAEARVLAREAGIAQITTGVLHNVGNALNSVNISLELITDSGIDARLDRLAKVGQMLAEHEHDLQRFLTDDPRGSKLPRYLALLAPELRQDAATFVSELDRLRERVDHVIRILRTYQEHGITRIDEELVEPTQLIRFAIEVALSGERQRRYAIIHDAIGSEPLTLDKHRTLEILINLVRNAADALDQAIADGLEQPRLELEIERDPDAKWVRFLVHDNGIGIASEDLDRIFAHGYTTKASEGRGFGLHASANAAVEMGGRLWARSEGLGTGATFILEIPTRDGPPSPTR